MKYYCVILSLLLFVNGCRDVGKSADVLPNKNGSPKISRITQAVGIGQIVPEKDIIQLSSPVNGIVQKIYKNENDSVKQGEKILELEHSVEDAKINQVYKEISTQTSQIKLDETSINDFRIKAQSAAIEKTAWQRRRNTTSRG
jgi:multidrug efflux pump subunit AcrA (membrane-fusion protein)